MKALIVTSRVTFVPDNYNQLILGLAELPQVGGLLELQNWDSNVFFKSVALMLAGARNTGFSLLKNGLLSGSNARKNAYHCAGKSYWALDDINCNEAVDIVKNNGFDLIINARTRYIYKLPILTAPRLGCINIHHGILPDQRGTNCDLWALYAGLPAGFSIHKMSTKIDDGEIVTVKEVDCGTERNFQNYLLRASALELKALQELLKTIDKNENIESLSNRQEKKIPHFKNPNFSEIQSMKKKGLIL